MQGVLRQSVEKTEALRAEDARHVCAIRAEKGAAVAAHEHFHGFLSFAAVHTFHVFHWVLPPISYSDYAHFRNFYAIRRQKNF